MNRFDNYAETHPNHRDEEAEAVMPLRAKEFMEAHDLLLGKDDHDMWTIKLTTDEVGILIELLHADVINLWSEWDNAESHNDRDTRVACGLLQRWSIVQVLKDAARTTRQPTWWDVSRALDWHEEARAEKEVA